MKNKQVKRITEGNAANIMYHFSTKVSRGTSTKALNDNEHKKRKKQLRKKVTEEEN